MYGKEANHVVKQAKQEKLHPSWEAKRNQKQAPVAFQGKKLTFDDQDAKPHQQQPISQGKKKLNGPVIDPDVHPSWKAKMEQKKKEQELMNVKPTKIVFDD